MVTGASNYKVFSSGCAEFELVSCIYLFKYKVLLHFFCEFIAWLHVTYHTAVLLQCRKALKRQDRGLRIHTLLAKGERCARGTVGLKHDGTAGLVADGTDYKDVSA